MLPPVPAPAPTRITAALLSLALLTTMAAALPATAQAAGRIQRVWVYPGGAMVERSAPVAAGATQVQLDCLPAGLQIESLQLAADDGIVVGDVRVQTLERAQAPDCRPDALDARIQALEDRKAAQQAEFSADELLLASLKTPPAAGPTAAGLGGYSETLRRVALEALARQQQSQRRQQALDEQLAPLLAERNRPGARNAQVRQVTVQLAAHSAGELRLSYRVPDAGWAPVYRAQLDTASGQLKLQRLAQVAQSSGEDWTGVRLRLSTLQPHLSPQPRPPQTWTLDAAAPAAPARADFAPMAAPAPAMAHAPSVARERALPGFDVSVFEGRYATEYEVPGTIQLRSDGQQVTYVLDAGQPQAARLSTRVQPLKEAQAYLVAEIPQPDGDWPAGLLQLYRDGDYVGQSRLAPGGPASMVLGFGRDPRLRVEVAPLATGGGAKGLLGARTERREQHRYHLDNRGKQALRLQVIEATPVARHDDIRVTSRFSPEPAPELWQDQPGLRAWQLTLSPGERITLEADYQISHPAGMRVIERR